MWLKTLLQIYQGTPGFEPGQKGWRREDERWVAIKFDVVAMGPVLQPPTAAFWEFLGTMADNPIMGRYTIKATNRDSLQTNQVDGSYNIGGFSAPENKVWLYNPGTLTLQLGNFITENGTAASNNKQTSRITNDLELDGVFLGATGFRVRQGGFGTGRVIIESSNRVPFVEGRIYWTEI